MARKAWLQTAAWLISCLPLVAQNILPATIELQDIPRAEVQELLDVHDRRTTAMQGEIDSLAAQVRSSEGQIQAWKDIAAAYERMKQADAMTIQAQQAAMDKLAQTAGGKRRIWVHIGQWSLRVAPLAFSLAAAIRAGGD